MERRVMTATPAPSSITATVHAVRHRPPPRPNRARDGIETEHFFFRCLMLVLLATQLLGMWGGYRLLERFAHPFPAPEQVVFAAVPDAK